MKRAPISLSSGSLSLTAITVPSRFLTRPQLLTCIDPSLWGGTSPRPIVVIAFPETPSTFNSWLCDTSGLAEPHLPLGGRSTHAQRYQYASSARETIWPEVNPIRSIFAGFQHIFREKFTDSAGHPSYICRSERMVEYSAMPEALTRRRQGRCLVSIRVVCQRWVVSL